jgi:hypothetical protein
MLALQMLAEATEICELVKEGMTPTLAGEVVRRSVEMRSLALSMETLARGASRVREKREDARCDPYACNGCPNCSSGR